MPLGYPAFRRIHRKRAPRWLVAIALGGFGLTQMMFLKMRDDVSPTITSYQTERLIAATIFADAGAEASDPEGLRRILGTSRSQLWREIQVNAESAERQGFFPAESYPSWALAAHWFGESDTARRLAEKFSDADSIDRLILTLIREESADPDDLDIAKEASTSGVADWRVLYLLDQFTGEPRYRNQISSSGRTVTRRDHLVSAAWWFAAGIGLVAGVGLVIRRKRLWQPPIRGFSLPSEWQVETAFAIFLGGLAISGPLSLGVWWLPIPFEDAALLLSILSYLVYLGLPTLFLCTTLTPGPRATAHLFGLRRIPYARSSLVAAGFAGFLVAVLINLPIGWIQVQFRLADFRDWLNFDALDSPIHFASQLVIAAVIAPFLEEITYRGFLYQTLKERANPILAALISSAVFASNHWYSLIGLFSIFAFGLLMCGMAHWSRSLWPGILAHGLFNLLLTWMLWANYSFV